MKKTEKTKTFIKRMLAYAMAVIMLLTIAPLGGFVGLELGLSASADWVEFEFTEGKYTYQLKDDGTAMITNYTGNDSNVVIPSTLGGYTVTSIAGAFYNCSSLTSATIPNSVTIIGYEAFRDCSNLTSVTIGNGVTSIGTWAFLNCSRLKSITIPNSVTTIGNGVFENCSSLTSVIIPNSIKSIGDYAFRDCSSLKSVTIPNSVTSIGYSTFYGCSSLTKITIPNSVTSIGDSAFDDCTSLTSVTIPNSVTSIGDSAFRDCSSLKSVTIPNSVTSIGRYAFLFCFSLTSVTIGNSVTTIGNEAFSNCKSMTSITIPNSVKSIGDSAFNYCPSLKDVYYTGSKAQWNKISIGGSYNSDLLNATIHYNYVPHTHSYTSKVTKATTSKAGKIVTSCTVCGTTSKTVTIAKVSTIKLSKTSYAYDGKAKTPTVTVKDSNGKALKNGTDYTVTHESGRKNIGTYTVKVTLKGNYSGSKTLKFKIVPAKVTSLKASSQTTKSVTLSWKKVTGAAGYVVYKYDSAKKAYVKVKATKDTTYKVTDLKAGTTYKFKVRAYKKVDGSNVYGSYSAVLSTATKTKAPTLTVTAGSKKATLNWKKITGATGYQVYMATSKDGKYKKVTTIKKAATVKYTAKDLTKGKTYYFKVRAYKTVGGKNIFSAYSSVVKVKVK